ncbi:MAG: hypothetical protein CW716_09120 [Candidatus Bathyarchaeum sp.]|nr:MAG: hypothetical protein CW716_09120 [Candidatus Bathyarchaeum sp.]
MIEFGSKNMHIHLFNRKNWNLKTITEKMVDVDKKKLLNLYMKSSISFMQRLKLSMHPIMKLLVV